MIDVTNEKDLLVEAEQERALEGLRKRVEAFDDPSKPYLAWAAPQFINHYPGDYDHLARLWEWHVIGEGESEGGGE